MVLTELGVAEGLGVASDSIFKLVEWNREVYKFDQDQRFEREELRLDMQMERFKLFREDISNLVELTVSRMDMYHMVGALILEFCIVLLTEGRVQSAPPFVLSAYVLSCTCAFAFLLLAVWLAMHASIASKSFGTRLLLRYVRLPLPSNAEIDALSSNLADYERQGLRNVLRVPFVQSSQWQPPTLLGKGSLRGAQPASSPKANATKKQNHALQRLDAEAAGRRQFLSDSPNASGSANGFSGSTGVNPGEHVELFQQLQAKWASFDAYARVCMSLGINFLLQSLSYFVIAVTIVSNDSPTAGFGLIVVFQAVETTLAVLDISGFRRCTIIAACVTNALPVCCCAALVSLGQRDSKGVLVDDQDWDWSSVIFFLILIRTQVLLMVCAPDLGSNIPRSFRAVFYMDVFNKADDPDESRPWLGQDSSQNLRLTKQAMQVNTALAKAKEAISSWERVPKDVLSHDQREQLEKSQQQMDLWHDHFRQEVQRCMSLQLLSGRVSSEASSTVKFFPNVFIGPLSRDSESSPFYLDAKSGAYIRELPDDSFVMTLTKVKSLAARCEEGVCSFRDMVPNEAATIGNYGKRTCCPPLSEETVASKLPWVIVWSVMRWIQVVTIWLFVVTLLRDCGVWHIDHTLLEAGDRRLAGLQVQQVDVQWPHGSLFRPTSMSCLPEAGAILSSSFVQYSMSADDNHSYKFRALARRDFPPGAVAVCASSSSQGNVPPCLMILPLSQGISVWPMHGARSEHEVRLSLVGQPWRLLTGSISPCTEQDAIDQKPDKNNSRWCLLLAGWDGKRIPIASVPLNGGLPRSGKLQPQFSVPWRSHVEQAGEISARPEQQTKANQAPLALHIGSNGTYVWTLSVGGVLRKWSFHRQRLAGDWLVSGNLKEAGMCEASGNALTFIGHNGSSAFLWQVQVGETFQVAPQKRSYLHVNDDLAIQQWHPFLHKARTSQRT
jgi:hypothetical protein